MPRIGTGFVPELGAGEEVSPWIAPTSEAHWFLMFFNATIWMFFVVLFFFKKGAVAVYSRVCRFDFKSAEFDRLSDKCFAFLNPNHCFQHLFIDLIYKTLSVTHQVSPYFSYEFLHQLVRNSYSVLLCLKK